MSDEDERVTEFVKILSNAVKREAENKVLRAQRDELLEALERVKATGVFLGAIPQEMVDAAIAKAKGE